MLSFTNWGYVLIILAYILFGLEIISPFIAGLKLYKKAIKNIKEFFG